MFRRQIASPPSRRRRRGRCPWAGEARLRRAVTVGTGDTVPIETVRRRLGEIDLKPWREKMWCIPKVDSEFVARMEDVVALSEAPADDARPVMFVDVNRPWRHAKVTDQRTSVDFADCMRELVDEHYPDAEQIRVVLDNLSTHTPAALYDRFEPAEARRILSRLEFHFTPKHASWLNMVEIEIGVMVSQCLDRRIPDKATLVREVAMWEQRRNREHAQIEWIFTVERARDKLARAYPRPTSSTRRRIMAAA